jgi:hypothetical protein
MTAIGYLGLGYGHRDVASLSAVLADSSDVVRAGGGAGS